MADTAVLGAQDQGAKATIQALLDSYGLGSLADWYWQKYLTGEPDAQIMLELRQTPQYQQRFPGMAELAANGRAISESQYIQNERDFYSLGRQYGVPADYIQAHLAGWIGGEVSPNEVQSRFDMYKTRLYNTPPDVRDELQRDFGLTEGDMLALIGNEKVALPLVQKQFLAAQAGVSARNAGFGALTPGEALRIAGYSPSADQLTQGFDALARDEQLFNPIVGETDPTAIDRQQQLDAAFGGNSFVQRQIEQRQAQRKAAFAGGGGFAQTNQGTSGLGSAAS